MLKAYFKLTCLFFDARSLRNKLPEVNFLLAGSLYSIKFDLIIVWLDACISDGLLLQDNTVYTLLRCDRANRIRGGGVCAFIRKLFKFVQVKIPQEYTLCEILCVDIFKDSFKQKFICAYRPPSANRQINDDLMRCLNFLCDIEFVSTICTDFNVLNFDWNADFVLSVLPNSEACFAKFIINNSITHLVSKPTCINNLVDLLLVNDPLAVFNVQVLQPFSTSNHSSDTWQTWFLCDTCFESAH